MTKQISEATLAKALAHPICASILRTLKDQVGSPGDLAVELDKPLGVVSYHVRMLRDYGCVELVRTEPRRGALQHFYKATIETPKVTTGEWISREAIVEALREGHRNDSAADQVQFVSELVGWAAEDDSELQAT